MTAKMFESTAISLVFFVLCTKGLAIPTAGPGSFQVDKEINSWHSTLASKFAADSLHVEFTPGNVIAVSGYRFDATLGRWARYLIQFKARDLTTRQTLVCRAYVHWPFGTGMHLDLSVGPGGFNMCWSYSVTESHAVFPDHDPADID